MYLLELESEPEDEEEYFLRFSRLLRLLGMARQGSSDKENTF